MPSPSIPGGGRFQAGPLGVWGRASTSSTRTGSSGYIWRVPPEAATRTRAEHLALNGVRCSWDEPPIISRRTGERGHPGHDPSCRCYAEPVFD